MEAQVQYALTCSDSLLAEAIPAMLSDLPFNTFRWDNGVWYCACPVSEDPGEETLREHCTFLGEIKREELLPQNYNALWEASVTPIQLDNRVYIRPPSYPPAEEGMIDICINPKMTFGTGHHETTLLLMRRLLQLSVAGKHVLDMGCGTAVLSILGLKLGASHCLAVDIDAQACAVAEELLTINCPDAQWEVRIDGNPPIDYNADIILANIHLQVLQRQCEDYFKLLPVGGRLLVSGLLHTQEEQLIKTYGREPVYRNRDGQWIMLEFEKT